MGVIETEDKEMFKVQVMLSAAVLCGFAAIGTIWLNDYQLCRNIMPDKSVCVMGATRLLAYNLIKGNSAGDLFREGFNRKQ
jgi:hypothetical protein